MVDYITIWVYINLTKKNLAISNIVIIIRDRKKATMIIRITTIIIIIYIDDST